MAYEVHREQTEDQTKGVATILEMNRRLRTPLAALPYRPPLHAQKLHLRFATWCTNAVVPTTVSYVSLRCSMI